MNNENSSVKKNTKKSSIMNNQGVPIAEGFIGSLGSITVAIVVTGLVWLFKKIGNGK